MIDCTEHQLKVHSLLKEYFSEVIIGLRDVRGLDIAHVSSRSNAEIDHEDGTLMSQNNDNELENMESHSQQHQLSDEEEQGNERLNSDPQNLPSPRTGSKSKHLLKLH